MHLSRRFGLSESSLGKLVLAILVTYVVAIQLPLLSP